MCLSESSCERCKMLWVRSQQKGWCKGKAKLGPDDSFLEQLNTYTHPPSRSSLSEVFLGKGVLKNMQQIYRRTPVLKCDFSKVGKQLGTRWEAASDHLRRIMKCIKSKPRLRERPLQQMIHVSKFWEQNYKTSQLLLL